MGPSSRDIFRCPALIRGPHPGQDVKAASSWSRGHPNPLAHVLHMTPHLLLYPRHPHPSPENTAQRTLFSSSPTRISGLAQVLSSLGSYLARSNPVALNFSFAPQGTFDNVWRHLGCHDRQGSGKRPELLLYTLHVTEQPPQQRSIQPIRGIELRLKSPAG